MRDVIEDLAARWEAGTPVAVATVVATWKSAPRGPGAAMLVGAGGVVGSVSGGCVEGAVYELGQEVLASGRPVLERYGVSDSDAMGVGLTCGGVLDVFVERLDRASFPDLASVVDDVRAGRPVAIATVIDAPEAGQVGRRLVVRADGVSGSLGSTRLDDAVTDDGRGLLAQGRTETVEYGPDGERRGEGLRVFVSSYAPRPRMLVFGSIDFAGALVRLASYLGYHVTVCDARAVFTTPARFPEADEVVVDWPHRYVRGEIEAGRLDARTAACLLTHDPKFDVPLLEVLLGEDAPELGYIGAMGSRRTHHDRLDRLREAGVSEAQLARLHSPIGLDLGARTPEETAVSITAEIISARWGGDGRPLRESEHPIHHDRPLT